MSYQTAQASQFGVILTPETLRPVNSLTRTSPKPGFLDYNTYLNLLIREGHVDESHPARSREAPALPLNSSLQMISLEGQNGDKTDFRADQALWDQNDLPHPLYLLERPPNWVTVKDLKNPPMKEYRIHGKILRDIPILPDHISSKVEGWRLQAWYGFDSRLKLSDILARIGKPTNGNTIMMRMLRFRTDCPALGWANKGPKFDDEKLRIEGLMRQAGLDPDCGRTRGIAWGVVNPDVENSRRIAIPNAKEWESSVETPTAAHLAYIPSPTLTGYSQLGATTTQLPQQLGATTMQLPQQLGATMMQLPQQLGATKTQLPQRHHDMESSFNGSEYMISDAEEDQVEDNAEMLDYEISDSPAVQPRSDYPRPEEVPRPLSVTDPLRYQQLYGVEKKGSLRYHPCF